VLTFRRAFLAGAGYAFGAGLVVAAMAYALGVEANRQQREFSRALLGPTDSRAAAGNDRRAAPRDGEAGPVRQ
jgi:hypothetical protein